MHSSISFEWKRPIEFSERLALAMGDLIEAFKERGRRDAVIESGRNPSQYTSAEVALEEYNSSKPSERDYDLKSLADEMRRISADAWSAVLKDGTVIKSISIDQLLKLPNAGGQSIETVNYDNSSSQFNLSIRFDNREFAGGVSVSIRGSLDLVQLTRRELENLLSGYVRPWWLVRSRYFYYIFVVLFVGFNIQVLVANLKQPGVNPYANSAVWSVLVPIISIFVLVAFPLFVLLSRWWSWIFPMVEFAFGGSATRAKSRSAVRWGLWAIPLLSFVFPFIVNKLS